MILGTDLFEINQIAQRLLTQKEPLSPEQCHDRGNQLMNLAPLPPIIEIDYVAAEQKVLSFVTKYPTFITAKREDPQ